MENTNKDKIKQIELDNLSTIIVNRIKDDLDIKFEVSLVFSIILRIMILEGLYDQQREKISKEMEERTPARPQK